MAARISMQRMVSGFGFAWFERAIVQGTFMNARPRFLLDNSPLALDPGQAAMQVHNLSLDLGMIRFHHHKHLPKPGHTSARGLP
jgi:hypothetical protein